MAKRKKYEPKTQEQKQKSFTPLWVRIVAIGCAALILATAVPLTVIALLQ